MKKIKLPQSYFNYISFLGTIIALIAWISFIFLIVMVDVFNSGNVYSELFTYLVVPVFLVLGFILIFFGMFLKRRRDRRGLKGTDDKLIINLKDNRKRNAILIFTSITVLFVMSTIVSTYEGFHYTESVAFCGKLCHKVMNPEFVAYQNSPHARIKCAECHVGEGVSWLVKSKISGFRQVFKYLNESYPRPISTPIENLRPARETCEKCHWPQKFYTDKLHQEKYYLADSCNTEWNVILNMKIGSSHEALGLNQGIHWHINPDIKMAYKADKKRETIYWVELTNTKTGKKTIYKDEENTINADSLKKLPARTMDCMDCHNRPSHEFRSPSYYINNLFTSDKISTSIPWLKKIVMDALNVTYPTKEAAAAGIKKQITNFYKEKYPSVYKKYDKQIANAISEIQNSYFQNAFPEMKVTYKEYPRHIGHLETNGCFRCHNDKHKSPEGKTISKNCYLCHSILGQGKKDSIVFSDVNKSVKFIHPVDIGNAWKESNCMDCHFDLYK
ncbi:MAG: NapC/NirT family cytochrome c [Bacteroidales bacterium]|jgi:nitrate/TMAO reductase-like tetraheme cytochrome c subunit